MCFSEEASFSAAAILAAVGIFTCKQTKEKKFLFLASIPLLFAIQQFSEGLVWMHFKQDALSYPLFLKAEHAFLTFAFLVWPIWLPLAFAAAETIKWRQKWLFFLLLCGAALSAINFIYALQEPVSVRVVGHSLQYMGHVPQQKFLYPFIVIAPAFLSSLPQAKLYGTLVLIALWIANYFYVETFTSVWCFFSALVSLLIYRLIKQTPKKEDSTTMV